MRSRSVESGVSISGLHVLDVCCESALVVRTVRWRMGPLTHTAASVEAPYAVESVNPGAAIAASMQVGLRISNFELSSIRKKIAMSAGKATCMVGVALIQQQLEALAIYMAALAYWSESGEPIPNVLAATGVMKSRRVPTETQLHSGGTPSANGDKSPSIDADLFPLIIGPVRLASLVKVAGSNAILAVAGFFEAHNLSTLRASEVQFLIGLREAITNGNTFRIERGQYLPVASLNGLVIDAALDGKLVFGEGTDEGFIEIGDVVYLLQVLRFHLQGMQRSGPGGDAG
jgi:hypothetical protein